MVLKDSSWNLRIRKSLAATLSLTRQNCYSIAGPPATPKHKDFLKTYLQAVQQPQQTLSGDAVSAQRLAESSMSLILALLSEELISLQVLKLAFRNRSLEM